ncbi:hypothetical protein LMG18090_01255 [Ralstonia mannitolilytica]|uniref:phage tail tube protein n=1 Tax=Ralstonia mannitolilytica TaxID=105219 RepID=UPI0028F5CC40|nr:hypothetical protein [Ralstonia mannitolilytica]CAJ0780939.1 hypothetical protein LMG18090_01255 [Ralstonia mannitolilytica]
MSTYASFQGRVFLGKRDAAGVPYEVRSPGNVAELKLSLKTDVLEHYESQTGQRTLDHRMVKQKSATLNLTIEEFTKDNLALALYGNHVTGTGGAVNGEPVGGATPLIGDRYFLAHPKVSNLLIKDASATPATLVAGVDYTADLDFGAIQFLRLDDGGTPPTPYALPFKATYTYGITTEIGIFTQPLPERYLRLEGLNTAQGNAKVLVELYRVAFDPLKELSLISDDYNKFEMEGSLLADATKPFDAVLGQFGRIVQL